MTLTYTLSQQLTPWLTAKRWIVGFSGGMDSTVLLHMLARLKQQQSLPELSAVYIHHGLQTVAEEWPAHCQQICEALAIPLQIINVKVKSEASIEQAARNARYQAFAQILQEGDVLFTAQHQNDQVETLLFRLARGAGVRGLVGIPKYRPLAKGTLARPLLDYTYDTLKSYAKANKLHWIDDPSNNDLQFARNYLRHQIIPLLQKQWPQVIKNIGQAANHLQEAQLLLNELAIQDLQAAQATPLYPWLTLSSLLLEPLINLSWARQKNALSYWLSHYTLLPTTSHWQGWQDFINAGESANPIWRLHNIELQRSNGRVWILTENWLTTPPTVKQPITTLGKILLTANGEVILTGELPNKPLFISYRQGGEVLNLANRGRRDLKKLFNEAVIPSFIRHRLPLLIDQQGSLIAVANFSQWRDQNYPSTFNFTWSPATN